MQVKGMFYHGFDNYMKYAFPLDELRPMSCTGADSLGSYSLTLVSLLTGGLLSSGWWHIEVFIKNHLSCH
jgi:hypothetical protein